MKRYLRSLIHSLSGIRRSCACLLMKFWFQLAFFTANVNVNGPGRKDHSFYGKPHAVLSWRIIYIEDGISCDVGLGRLKKLCCHFKSSDLFHDVISDGDIKNVAS